MSGESGGSGRVIGVIALTLSIAIAFGELYRFVIARLHVVPWVGVLIAHAGLAFLFLIIRKPAREALAFRAGPILPWLPGVVVLAGAYALAVYSPNDGAGYSAMGSADMAYMVATLTVIPLVEELVFRCGVSPFLSRFMNGWWSVWFAAIIFSMAHTNPTWNRLLALKVGVPFGPFILALCCDMIVRRWGRVWPAVFFHSACNGTVYIFATINPSWLKRLGGLYM